MQWLPWVQACIQCPPQACKPTLRCSAPNPLSLSALPIFAIVDSVTHVLRARSQHMAPVSLDTVRSCSCSLEQCRQVGRREQSGHGAMCVASSAHQCCHLKDALPLYS